jgi:hypothetical protein
LFNRVKYYYRDKKVVVVFVRFFIAASKDYQFFWNKTTEKQSLVSGAGQFDF